MKKILYVCICIMLCSCAVEEYYDYHPNIPGTIDDDDDFEDIGGYFSGEWATRHDEVSKANNVFALNFFKKLSEQNGNDNVLVSPYSAQLALSMVANGANGNTLDEIISTLGFEGLEMRSVNEYNALMQTILQTSDPEATFSIANGCWADNGKNAIELKKGFKSSILNYYNAESESLDFASGEAETVINDWISENTNGKIYPFFKPDALENQALVLANALYFKGGWRPDLVEDVVTGYDKFQCYDGQLSIVERMEFTAQFAEQDIPGGRLLSIPFANEVFSFDIILPDEKQDINTFITQMDMNSVPLLDMKQTKLYKVQLPYLKETASWDLKKCFKEMGIKDAFDYMNADFSKLSNQSTVISFVQQKAFLNVNEGGCEAGAVTAFPQAPSGVYHGDYFIAYRPFIYMIRDHITGNILFMGKVLKL